MQTFLEAHLKDVNVVTPQRVQQLKRQWRKEYVCRYNKKYQQDHIQITFRVSKKQYKELSNRSARLALKPTVYCRRLVLDIINDATPIDLQPLKTTLLEVFDIVEEAAFEGDMMRPEKLLSLLKQMQTYLK